MLFLLRSFTHGLVAIFLCSIIADLTTGGVRIWSDQKCLCKIECVLHQHALSSSPTIPACRVA